MDSTTRFMGLIWGSVGYGYFVYGKKQQKAMPLITGIVLMILPCLIPNNLLLTAAALAVAALPDFVQI